MTLVSIVVIGRNEGERLARCLESIAHTEHTGFKTEVIYVDSGSIDMSLELASAMGARTIAINPIRPSAATGRNAGWRAARGEIVLFLDGDTVLHPRFIADSLAEFEDHAIAVVWGHRRELYPERSIYNRALDLDWIYAPGLTLFCGGDALFRTEILRATGGFDETLIAGEEPELCRRILATGSKILHVDRPMTGHDLAMTEWAQYWKRATRAGHAYAEVAARFAATGEPFWSEEVKRTRNRALVLQGVALTGLIATFALWSPWPLLMVIALFSLLIARTAWKARWKASGNWFTLLVYGAHSHMQQIPIFWGQIQYARNHRQGKRAMLVEYK